MMRRHGLLTVLASGVLAACATGKFEPRAIGLAQVTTPDEALARARRNFALNNVALALEDFRKAARANPDDIRALNGIAACYDRMGRFDLSHIYYERALALAPQNSATQHNYRLSLHMQGLEDDKVTFAASTAAEPAPQSAAAESVIARATGNEVISLDIEPAPLPENMAAGPRLERISLGEVALVSTETGKQSTSPATKPRAPASAAAGRVVSTTQARLVRQSARGSEWVFDEPATESSPPAKMQLQLLNAVGRRGLAARYRGYLKSQGWADIRIADARNRRDRSVILHGSGQARATARTLAAGLPFRARVETARAARPRIILLLGTDSLGFDERLKNRARRS